MQLTGSIMYQGCRVHTSRLESKAWVASVVAPGGGVEHLRGEFRSQEEAIRAAKTHIDERGQTQPPE